MPYTGPTFRAEDDVGRDKALAWNSPGKQRHSLAPCSSDIQVEPMKCLIEFVYLARIVQCTPHLLETD